MKAFSSVLGIVCLTISLSAQNFDTPKGYTFPGNHSKDILWAMEQALTGTQKERVQSRTVGELLDSSFVWDWDNVLDEWNYSTRTTYTTDLNGNLLTDLISIWNGFEWTNETFNTKTYDGNDNLLSFQIQNWGGGQWDNISLHTYEYDGNQNLVSLKAQNWNGNEWENIYQVLFTYNAVNSQLTSLTSLWENNDWQAATRNTLTYNSSNQRVHRLVENYTSEWMNSYQVTSTYDANGDQDTTIQQNWDGVGWFDLERYSYDFNVNHQVTSLRVEAKTTGVWEDYYHITYEYDPEGNLTLRSLQFDSPENWIYNFQYLSTYNDADNQLTEVYQIWDEEWTNVDSTYFYYGLPSSIGNSSESKFLQAYPNPAGSFINIVAPDQTLNDYPVSIYSANGMKVMEIEFNAVDEVRIDIHDLFPGAYHIVLPNDQGLYRQTFIKK